MRGARAAAAAGVLLCTAAVCLVALSGVGMPTGGRGRAELVGRRLVRHPRSGQVGAVGEGQDGAVGPWRHSREVHEGSHNSPRQLDFTVPLNRDSRVRGGAESFVKGLDLSELDIHARLEQPNSAYSSGFPHSYFEAQPNPDSKYTWVCPGPSLLDDPHSGACPESSTVGFRCCIDSANGGAVADDMCCPSKEREARLRTDVSKRKLADQLSGVLLHIVEKLEREKDKALPPQPKDYISTAQADRDLDAYFDQQAPGPAKTRSLAAGPARKDLQDFFGVLKRGDIAGLLPHPHQPRPAAVPRPGDVRAVERVAGRYAGKLQHVAETAEQRRRDEAYGRWRKRSEGGGGGRGGRMQVMEREEKGMRERSERRGREEGDRWQAKDIHFYTARPGGEVDGR